MSRTLTERVTEVWENRTLFSLNTHDEFGEGSRFVVIPSAPRRRDLMAVLLGRWVPAVTVYERKTERHVDDRHFMFGGLGSPVADQKINLDHYERHVSDEARQAYRAQWEKQGRPEPRPYVDYGIPASLRP